MAVPYTFSSATSAIPLSQLDSNFATTITLGNTAIQLGNTVTTLNNMTLANVTISSGSVSITDVTASGNVTLSGGTANGVAYLNGSKIVTTGSAFVFDGTNVGIGTSSPGTRLQVDSGSAGYAITVAASSQTSGIYKFGINSSNNLALYGSYAGTDIITVSKEGNLGLGVTPSAWGSGYKTVQIGESGNTVYTGNSMFLVNNAYNNGTNWIYQTNFGAGVYEINKNTRAHIWYTAPSGTAGNAITFTQAMTLDASGNLCVGATSPGARLQVTASSGDQIKLTGKSSTNGDPDFKISRTSSATTILNAPNIYFEDGTANNTVAIQTGAGNLQFWNYSTGSWNERMRIDSSGNLLVGTTGDISNGGFALNPLAAGNSYQTIGHKSGTASGNYYIGFYYAGSNIGSITQNGTTGVLYNLTSDYRLKNNPTPVTGAKEFVMALQPKTWDWWDGSGKGVGFIAHEFMEVAKYSGHGEKDAVDEEGKPIYQSIQPSSSEVMANLVALLQEQQAIIEQLQADVASLKG